MEILDKDLQYLKLLAKKYPSIASASREIINLTAILNLPKGTEHFLSDVHGEHEAFLHVLKNASGVIRRKIDDVFQDTLTDDEKKNLATIIFYPQQKVPLILKNITDKDDWYKRTLTQLIQLTRNLASKYSRSRVRKALPPDFDYIIDELLSEQEGIQNRAEYYQTILDTIIETSRAHAFVQQLAELIQRLAIDHLHVLGDIFDRGGGPHIIMDKLMEYHSVDIQWGNHDILWMGAAAGCEAAIANVVRIALRYTNTNVLEDGYSISLLPLATLAMDVYENDPASQFHPKLSENRKYSKNEIELISRMHKAISIIQFKLEERIIRRRPQYHMEDRLLLDKIDYEKGTILLDGKTYSLLDTHFPTINPENPYALTDQEQYVMDKLVASFANSDKLHRHVRFLFSRGGIYTIYNNNLLFHGCIAMNEDGSFREFKVGGEKYGGKSFLDRVDRLARVGYFTRNDPEIKRYGMDVMWYLWAGSMSPLFGKEKMATFERYFLAEKETHEEIKNPYYKFRDREEMVDRILKEFGLDPKDAHIVNGHVPVKAVKGESPIKANGKLIVIDGGFSRAYQKETGIAGYTLIYNSFGFLLAAHKPFESAQKAIEQEEDMRTETIILEKKDIRLYIKDSDKGRELMNQIADLKVLLRAYREGWLKENA